MTFSPLSFTSDSSCTSDPNVASSPASTTPPSASQVRIPDVPTTPLPPLPLDPRHPTSSRHDNDGKAPPPSLGSPSSSPKRRRNSTPSSPPPQHYPHSSPCQHPPPHPLTKRPRLPQAASTTHRQQQRQLPPTFRFRKPSPPLASASASHYHYPAISWEFSAAAAASCSDAVAVAVAKEGGTLAWEGRYEGPLRYWRRQYRVGTVGGDGRWVVSEDDEDEGEDEGEAGVGGRECWLGYRGRELCAGGEEEEGLKGTDWEGKDGEGEVAGDVVELCCGTDDEGSKSDDGVWGHGSVDSGTCGLEGALHGENVYMHLEERCWLCHRLK